MNTAGMCDMKDVNARNVGMGSLFQHEGMRRRYRGDGGSHMKKPLGSISVLHFSPHTYEMWPWSEPLHSAHGEAANSKCPKCAAVEPEFVKISLEIVHLKDQVHRGEAGASQ